jgi:RNA polymerase sigma factor (sigma-70 family)
MLAQPAEHTSTTETTDESGRENTGGVEAHEPPAPVAELQPAPSPAPSLDERLRSRTAGQDVVFAEVYRQYRPFVASYIQRRIRTRDRGWVEDLTQDTFLRVWPKLEQGTPPIERMHGLLATIARGVMVNHYQRHQGGHQVRPEHERITETCVPPDSVLWQRTAYGDAKAEPETTRVDEHHDLATAWQKLPAETRAAVYHRAVDGESWQQIAHRLRTHHYLAQDVVHEALQTLRHDMSAGYPAAATAAVAAAREHAERLDERGQPKPSDGATARARSAARAHAAEHAALPSITRLQALAGCSHGTAGNVLVELRAEDAPSAGQPDSDAAAPVEVSARESTRDGDHQSAVPRHRERGAGERARQAAQRYLAEHGELPTGRHLATVAGVRLGTAGYTLTALRRGPAEPRDPTPGERARSAAQAHAAEHGQLPTLGVLCELAGVSKTTASRVMRQERGTEPEPHTSEQATATAAVASEPDQHDRAAPLVRAHRAVARLARHAACSRTNPAQASAGTTRETERDRSARIARWHTDDHATQNHATHNQATRNQAAEHGADRAAGPVAVSDDELVLSGGMQR